MGEIAEGRKPRNWWKIGFFVLLVVFEVTRELLVISSQPQAQPGSAVSVFAFKGYVVAEGSWKRIDGGERLVPGTVTIQCRQERAECLEASVMIYDNSVFAPDITYYPAKFDDGSVSFENDGSRCVTYRTRIDFKLDKAFSVRTRKKDATDPICSKMEERIEMQLSNGYEFDKSRYDKHFLPISSLIRLFTE